MTTWPAYKTLAEEEARAAELFAKDIDGHELTIVHDADGIVHLRARRPDANQYWFDVTATPTQVSINGDMGAFMFFRYGSPDQLSMFRAEKINLYYWNQKLVAGAHEQYSADAYIETVVDAAKDHASFLDDNDDELEPNEMAAEALGWTSDLTENAANAFIAEVKQSLLSWVPESGPEAYERLADSSIDGLGFECSSDLSLERPTFNYLWCLNALMWAVAAYDQAKASGTAAA